MDIGKKIKEQRSQLGYSQEDLAEAVYVTRQTISSWENDKSYPDVHSLILLSRTFDITVDELLKGDLVKMQNVIEQIEKVDIKNMKIYAAIMWILEGIALVFLGFAIVLGFTPGFIIMAIVFIFAGFFAYKVEKIKKQYDVQTYKEIVAFINGKNLDEIAKIRESGKRGYQIVINILTFMVLSGAVTALVVWLFR